MKHSDIALLMKGAAPAFREYLAEAVAPLVKRIAELETQIASIPAGRDGKDGAAGKQGDKGIDGANGKDGSDGAPGAAGRGIAKLLIDANGHLIATYSDGAVEDVGYVIGKDGKAGTDGKDGAPGKDGVPGERGEKGEPGEKGADGKHGEPGKDGKPGLDGAAGKDGAKGIDGRDGVDGKDGAAGLNGKDGVGLADAMLDREGNLVLTMTDGRHKSLGMVIGAAGKDGEKGADGRDGKDGLGFDDLSVGHDGEREIILRFARGDQVKEFTLSLPVVLDRGVWVDGKPGGYAKGDGVTWAGSFWISQKEGNTDKPDGGDGWRLAVKRGRDGKEVVKL